MKNIYLVLTLFVAFNIFSCSNEPEKQPEQATNTQPPASGGQENVKDDESQKDVVKAAMGSKDHTTLVAAIKQADLVTTLSNAGPFTVFAPTNAAFDKLPAGTVDGLMKPEKKEALTNILEYHVTVGVLKPESFADGQSLGMVNGDNVKVTIKDGKVMLNNSATITASIPVSNGIIHVVDAVLLPPEKK
ncbi:MAG: fasciclin domain-containing protein [Bacteroidetes bacterium]|nr:fasciclin domain-containing protein [Bacteroidota bacterium]